MFQSAVPGPQSSVMYFDSTPQTTKYAAGSKSWRTNNPGLVGMSTLTTQHGALGSALGVAVFGDPAAGRRALIACLGHEDCASATVAQTLSCYIPGYTPPPQETDPANGEPQPWMEPQTGIDLELTMSALGGGQRQQLADLIEREIGFVPGIISKEPLDAGSFNQSQQSSGSLGNVLINGRSAAHAGSGGTLSTMDVCETPRGDSCPPRLYTNVAKSSDAAQTAGSVKINGNPACIKSSIFSKSTGDQPGRCGGTSSGTIKGKAEFITASPNVMIEGEAATRQFDLMISNNQNTPPAPLMQSGGARPPFLDAGEAEEKEATPSPFRVPLKAESTELHQLKSLTIVEDYQARAVPANANKERLSKDSAAIAQIQTWDSGANTSSQDTEPAQDTLDLSCQDADGSPAVDYPYTVKLSNGQEHKGNLDTQGKAHLENLPPGQAEVIFGNQGNNEQQIRNDIQATLTRIIQAEEQEAAEIEARLAREDIFGKALEYELAKGRGAWKAVTGFLSFVNEAADLVSPQNNIKRALGAAWQTWRYSDEDAYAQAFVNNFSDAEFKELADVIGIDPRSITREQLAEAKALANFIWEDSDTQSMLVSFAKDYVSAQHNLEIIEGGASAVTDVAITILISALTLGAGGVLLGAAKNLRHADKLKPLGNLLRKLANALKLKRGKKSVKTSTGSTAEAKLEAPKSLGKEAGNDGTILNEVNAPDKPLMSSADMHGVEPASQQLIDAVSGRRSIAWATEGSDELRMLQYFNAEASVSSDALGRQGMSIILKPNPSKPAVLEEFLHGTQNKFGLPDQFGTEWSEVHVKSFMLRHQSMLGIGDQDADILRTLLQRDISDLNRVMQQQPEKYFRPIKLPKGIEGLGE